MCPQQLILGSSPWFFARGRSGSCRRRRRREGVLVWVLVTAAARRKLLESEAVRRPGGSRGRLILRAAPLGRQHDPRQLERADLGWGLAATRWVVLVWRPFRRATSRARSASRRGEIWLDCGELYVQGPRHFQVT